MHISKALEDSVMMKRVRELEIIKHFEFPSTFVKSRRTPTKEEIQELSRQYQKWRWNELVDLWYFRQVHKKPESAYRQAYCANCQTDIHYKNDKGKWHYRRPKVEINFRLFVAMCFHHISVYCTECGGQKEDMKVKDERLEMGIPMIYTHCMFNNWDQTWGEHAGRFLEAAQTFIENHKNFHGIFISGAAGTGKTRLASSIMNELHVKYEGTFKMRFETLHQLAKEGRDGKKNYRTEYVEPYDLMCIDEITKENIGYEFGQYVYPIIDERVKAGKKTIVTTNIELQSGYLESDNGYLQRLGDRFKEFIRCSSFGQPSQRGK